MEALQALCTDHPRSPLSSTPLSPSLAPFSSPAQSRVMQLCKCSKCIQKQYIDDYNVTHQGVPLDAKRIKQHALDDKFREAAEKARQKAQADVANDIVLATLGAPSRPDQQSLPVRPKSRRPPVKDEVDEGQSEDDEVGTSSGGGSGVRTLSPSCSAS